MKKLTFLFALASISGYSQTWNTNGNSGINPNTDFLGTTDNQSVILKTNNAERLKIDGDGKVTIKGSDGYGGRLLTLDGEDSGIGIFQIGLSGCNGCWGQIKGSTVMRNLGDSHNIVLAMSNDNNDGNSFIGIDDGANGTWVKFFNNATARFNGKIFAKEVQVKANVWADYVFANNYKLSSLEEVEKHISEKGHLPNVPSAKEILDNGINVAEMDAKLLEKIEELTLYSIEQNKQIKKQSSEIEELKNQVKMLLSSKK